MTRPRDLATLVRVSRLYYDLGETQEAIAHTLGVTRPHVSKLLRQARAQGVVEIRVVDPAERTGAIATELARRFDLRAVHLAPTFVDSDELTRRRVGRIAADVLVTAARDDMVVGIGDGSSVGSMAQALDGVASPIGATVVPLCGGFWGATGNREPFRRIADALGATALGLMAPGLLDDGATRDALRRHAGIQAVTALWDRLDIAVFGIGGPAWSESAVGPEVIRELETAGAVGEILIAPFDVLGRFVGESLRRRTIAFDARDLVRVPTAIGIASGSSKILPILGALRTRAIGTLVTDVGTAEHVLALAGVTTGDEPSAARRVA